MAFHMNCTPFTNTDNAPLISCAELFQTCLCVTELQAVLVDCDLRPVPLRLQPNQQKFPPHLVI